MNEHCDLWFYKYTYVKKKTKKTLRLKYVIKHIFNNLLYWLYFVSNSALQTQQLIHWINYQEINCLSNLKSLISASSIQIFSGLFITLESKLNIFGLWIKHNNRHLRMLCWVLENTDIFHNFLKLFTANSQFMEWITDRWFNSKEPCTKWMQWTQISPNTTADQYGRTHDDACLLHF